ncbi:MAG TPA: ABC transporter permease subunit [Gemmatimonadales bacterium]|nr:ABC transporter permease subunit [Gemmatimonadales bacterium]
MTGARPLAVAGFALSLAACVGERPQAFRWGGDAEGGAPFVEADPADPSKVRGFDVEVAQTIARGLGRDAAFVQVQWSSLDQAVERGDFAIGLSGVEDTPTRRAQHAVTIPYFEFREVLAVRAVDRERFRRLADLRGRRVATLGATTAYEILLAARDSTGIIPVSYDDDVHPYTDLVAGRVDAVLLDHIIAERALRRMTPNSLAIEPGAVALGRYVGVLANAHAALRDSVNAVLREAMRDGTLERILRRWQVWDPSQGKLFERALREPAGPVAAARVTAPVATALAYLPALARAALMTALVSLLSMALAVAAGLAVASARVYGPGPVRALAAVYTEVVRGTPVLLQLFVIYYGLAGIVRLPAFLAAVLGLGLNYAAYESEIYRGALEAVSRNQLEAARTLGFSESQILRLVRGPQALRYALAPMTNDFVALLKDSSLVSVITVIELTKQTAIYATNVGSWVIPGMLCAAVYLVMSLPLAHLARLLERRWSAA